MIKLLIGKSEFHPLREINNNIIFVLDEILLLNLSVEDVGFVSKLGNCQED